MLVALQLRLSILSSGLILKNIYLVKFCHLEFVRAPQNQRWKPEIEHGYTCQRQKKLVEMLYCIRGEMNALAMCHQTEVDGKGVAKLGE